MQYINTIKKYIKYKLRELVVLTSRISKYGFQFRGDLNHIKFLSDENRPTFFGYHDKSPFSLDGRKLLATSILKNDRDIKSECSLMNVGYFETDNNGIFQNKFIKVGETITWCFQQGCMLQWNPLNYDREIYFNDLVNEAYGAKKLDVQEKKVIREYSNPIYAVHPQKEVAVTLNFSRLGRLRPGYGYNLINDWTSKELAPVNDGLYLLDLKNDKKELIVSLSELASDINGEKSEHYINHATFSPDGTYISFLHLWNTQKNKRRVRFCIYSMNDRNWFVLEGNRSVSHHAWVNDDQILINTNETNSNKIRRVSIYSISNNSFSDVIELKNGDTHPMRSPNNNKLFIMDSYPNKLRDQHLFTFNIETKEYTLIKTIYSPLKYSKVVRCDLHSRWDHKGDYIAVDTAVYGVRKLGLVKIKDIISMGLSKTIKKSNQLSW